MSFRQALGLYDATMIVTGSMIGSGIFIVSADIARVVQSPMLLLAVWAVTGLLTLIAALSYGELAGMMPQAGGQYVYLREAFGPMWGFLYGWTLFTVIQTGTIAAVAMAFAKYTGVFAPAFSENNILTTIAGVNISGAQLLAIASIIVLTWVNSRGVQQGKIVQNVFTTTKIVALAVLVIFGLWLGIGSGPWTVFTADPWHSYGASSVPGLDTQTLLGLGAAIAVAMVGSLFSSDAWNNITFTAGEVKNPKRVIPLSLFYGVSIVTVLYILANIAYLAILPFDQIQAVPLDRVGSAAVKGLFGSGGELFMAALIMVSTFGCNNGLILAGARASYAMAQDGLFFGRASTLNKAGVPAYALWIQAAWASALCLSGRYGDLLDYVIMAVMVFYILTIAGIFRLRRTRPDAERPYKAIGYPVLPALYIIGATAVCVALLIYKPSYTWPGLGIVALGVPVYLIWKRRPASA